MRVVKMDKAHWKAIKKVFTPAPRDAQAERSAIAKAVGAFEVIAGAQTGTSNDIGGTFYKFGPGQLDCVDESINTTIYLNMLEQSALMRFHHVLSPTARLPIIHAGRWPHQSAVIEDIESGERFVVDSWFHDNGVVAEIVSIKEWKDGWKP